MALPGHTLARAVEDLVLVAEPDGLGRIIGVHHLAEARPVLGQRDLGGDRAQDGRDGLLLEPGLAGELHPVPPVGRGVVDRCVAAATGRQDGEQQGGHGPSPHRFAPPRRCRAHRSGRSDGPPAARRPPVWRRRPGRARSDAQAPRFSEVADAGPRYNGGVGRERPGDRANPIGPAQKRTRTHDARKHDPAPVPGPRRRPWACWLS